MNVLIIEDDALKCGKLADLLGEVIPHVQFTYARSYKSGLRAATAKNLDLIILDMTLPSFDITEEEEGGDPMTYGGRELLRQLKRRGKVVPVIVVTQFEQFDPSGDAMTLGELTTEMERDFSDNLVGTVYYNPTQSRWRELLRAKVELVMAGRDV